jgi:hypothetical protein
MIRGLGLLGLGGGFLAISPHMRYAALSTFGVGVGWMDKNSPYSYLGGAVGIMCLLMVLLYRGAQPR